jgi:hypothetical protein
VGAYLALRRRGYFVFLEEEEEAEEGERAEAAERREGARHARDAVCVFVPPVGSCVLEVEWVLGVGSLGVPGA